MRDRALGAAIAIVVTPVITGAAHAGSAPPVGEPAPAVTAKAWLNVARGEEPTPERLKGRAVMIEFWGTWCGPCVRAMPHVQELSDRYKDRGLSVVAISYEEPATLEPFLAKNGWTMTVGSDPEKTCIEAYGVSSWPTTAVIDKDGKLAYLGSPYGVEAAVEKVLGLESSPASLLTQYLAVAGTPAARAPLERLVEKATADFDVRAWAAELGGAKDAKVAGRVDAAKSLADYAKAPADKRRILLDQLAAAAAPAFDLLSWARDALGREFPVTQKEIEEMLAAKRFDAAIDALLDRRPSPAALGTAAKCIPLAVHCTQHGPESRTFARKALLSIEYVFSGRQLSEEKNKELWADLATSGAATSEDKKRIVGVILGGGMVMATQAGSYFERQLGRSLVMADLAQGDKPALSKLDAAIASQRELWKKEFRAKYGE